jgi:hypothetical protein
MGKKNVEMPKTKTGQNNPKYVDALTEDKPLNGQNFVCLSFLSPEKILQQKEQFFFQEFIQSYDKETSIKRFSDFLGFVSYKYNLKIESLTDDLNEFLKEESSEIFKTSLADDYKSFLDRNEDKLQEEFDQNNNFQTSVRGIKIRGSFEELEEAKLRAELLRESDPYNQIYVGEVGKWMPWEPEYYKTGQVEYLEPELNTLMQEKDKQDKLAKNKFEERVKDAKKKAIEDNIQKAEKSGNVLTQNIDEQGNLVSIGNDNTTSNNLRKELFEGDNIRTKEFDKTHTDPMLEKITKK